MTSSQCKKKLLEIYFKLKTNNLNKRKTSLKTTVKPRKKIVFPSPISINNFGVVCRDLILQSQCFPLLIPWQFSNCRSPNMKYKIYSLKLIPALDTTYYIFMKSSDYRYLSQWPKMNPHHQHPFFVVGAWYITWHQVQIVLVISSV